MESCDSFLKKKKDPYVSEDGVSEGELVMLSV